MLKTDIKQVKNNHKGYMWEPCVSKITVLTFIWESLQNIEVA